MVSKSDQKFRTGRAYRDTCVNIAKARANISMFNLMIRKGLATNDIRQFSLKQAAQQRVSKGPSLRLEKSAMKNKRSDLLAYEKRLKQQRLRLKRRLLSLYDEKDHRKISQVIRKINWCANKL